MSNKKYKTGDKILTSVRSWETGRSGVKNTPYVRVNLENYIEWTGWLTPKAMENVMKTLSGMGFRGGTIGMLKSENALDKNIELSAEIEKVREYNGKWYHSAKWVNKVSAGFMGEMDDDISDIDTRAYIDNPIDENVEPSNDYSDIHTDASFTADDIPF